MKADVTYTAAMMLFLPSMVFLLIGYNFRGKDQIAAAIMHKMEMRPEASVAIDRWNDMRNRALADIRKHNIPSTRTGPGGRVPAIPASGRQVFSLPIFSCFFSFSGRRQ